MRAIRSRAASSTLRLLVALAVLAPASAVFAADANDPSREQIERAVAKVYPALVRIYVVVTDTARGRVIKQLAAGSGAIISPEGYVVTNHHVAGRAERIVCNLSDGQEIDADLVGTDPLTDLAVLKLRLDQRADPNAPVPVAQWGDSDSVRVGDVVLAMGSPGALAQSVTKGIVANTRLTMPGSGTFSLEGENVGALVRWIGHDAVIFHGNSGGPLVNLDGRIIGINEIGVASLGGAIPGNLARKTVRAIIQDGYVPRSWIGLEVQPRLRGDVAGRGVLVSGVAPNSPAADAGLRAGDMIVGFGDRKVDVKLPEEMPLFNQVVADTPIGATVGVHYVRDGNELACKLTTAAREPTRPRPVELKGWGMTGGDLSRAMALEMRRKDRQGVLVDSLTPGGPADQCKPSLLAGDVILQVAGREVRDVQALRAVSRAVTAGKSDPVPTLVQFERGPERLWTVVKIGKEPTHDRPALARKPWPAAETQVLTRDIAEAMGIPGRKGVIVTQLYAGRAAEKAGLKVGDILLKLDGRGIDADGPEDVELFHTMIRQYRIGSEVKLDLVRDGNERAVTMTLEAPPRSADRMETHEDDDFEFVARDLSFRDRSKEQLETDQRGVLIIRVEPGGWASLGGLRSGDVLLEVQHRPVGNVDDLAAALTAVKAERPRRVVLFVQRGVHTRYLQIEPDWKQ